MNLVYAIREAISELRRLAGDVPRAAGDIEEIQSTLAGALEDPGSAVDLATCIGSECLKMHGVRLATWRGTGPCSIYIVCDECHAERLTAEEREHMVELFGAAWIRHLGLHSLHSGRIEKATGRAKR